MSDQPKPDLFTDDELGEVVREAWIGRAVEQPEIKPSWLVPYQDLSQPDKDADIAIGKAVIQAYREKLLGHFLGAMKLAMEASRD